MKLSRLVKELSDLKEYGCDPEVYVSFPGVILSKDIKSIEYSVHFPTEEKGKIIKEIDIVLRDTEK